MSLYKVLGLLLALTFTLIVQKIDAGVCHDRIGLSESHFPYEDGNFRRAGRSAKKRRRHESSSDDASQHHTWHWNYRNIDEWAQHYPDCNGKKQSPVDLNSKLMTRLKVSSPFRWNGYRKAPRNMTIVNNGHTVQLSGAWANAAVPYLSGGTLVGDYVFAQLHFHWGPKNDAGSEHTINGISLPLEMHMVHYKREYGSVSEALKHDDGLAVAGVFMKVGKKKNPGIFIMQRNNEAIKQPNGQISIRPFPLSKFRIKFPGEYASYSGSLTTPPCSEVVTWILPANPRFVTQNQLDNFRRINLANGDDRNYRPTLPLNDRMLYFIDY